MIPVILNQSEESYQGAQNALVERLSLSSFD